MNVRDINWTYSASYAEEGKRGESLTFFDGSGRARQSMSKDNSTGKALIGENIYDHEGRQALNIAATPHANGDGRMRFYESYNVNVNGAPFSKTDFDLDRHYGYQSTLVQRTSLSITSGSAAYYSGNNIESGNHSGSYIADAGAKPYTHTTFDNQGRPQLISGVGPEMGLGGGHEMRYVYGNVLQEELDRWFGAEVGYAEHYRKKAIRDPNGQWSVSYETLAGQVVMTTLVGDPPQDASNNLLVEAVDNSYGYTPSRTITSDLSRNNS